MTSVNLTLRLLRAGGARGLLGAGLMAAAVALSTALLLAAAAANVAFDHRADRETWRHPGTPAASADAVAIEATSVDYVRGKQINVIDLAALDRPAGAAKNHQALPTPPGMPRFPEPGEVWMSPALARLAASLPANQLADRFGPASTSPDSQRTTRAHPTGLLGEAALVHDGELVAVVGRASTDPAMRATKQTAVERSSDPTPIASFQEGEPSTTASTYRVLTVIATILLGVPLLVFGGAAARLTVARRDQRLAALRLVGATPGQVVAMTVTESVLTALGGAVAGVVLYLAMIPGLAQIRIEGGTWALSDLWVGLPIVLATVVAVALLVGVSAIVGLRRVVVSPLGVARRETPPGLRMVRLLAFAAAIVAFLVASKVVLGWGSTGKAVIIALLGLGFWTINLVGPWVVALIGRLTAAAARRPAGLLAGRRLVDDPRSAWRTVSGVALTGFVAGFTVLLSPAASVFADSPDNQLSAAVPAQQVQAVSAEARQRLRDVPGAALEPPDEGDGDGETSGSADAGHDGLVMVTVTVPGGPERVDQARTALAGVVPGRPFTSPADGDRSGAQVLLDIRTGALTVLIASFLIGTVSAGISGVSSVLDRRQTFALLRLAGTPLRVLDAARRWCRSS
ncbi:FtsX-like permease family protein [Actinopolymorpha pittospori]